VALTGQWRYSLVTEKLTAAMRIAERVYSLAQEQDDPALMIGAYRALAGTLHYLGDFESARQYAMRGIQIWRSGNVQSHADEYYTPAVGCLGYGAMSEWHLGEMASCQANMNEAISLAKELNDTNALVLTLNLAASLAYRERNPAKVDRLASEMIEVSTRHNIVFFLTVGAIHRGWARSASGDTAEGILWIENGIAEHRAAGWTLAVPDWLARKAEALHLAGRTSEALDAIIEAEALAERFEERNWCAELHRLRGVFLTAMVPTKPRLRLRSAQPSVLQRRRSRFHSRNAPKEPTQNIAGKKRERQEGADFDYLFSNCLPLARLLLCCLSNGIVNPSGKLPITMEKRIEDNPAAATLDHSEPIAGWVTGFIER
jgi:tetratricopeptide (TPR) repeat protein